MDSATQTTSSFCEKREKTGTESECQDKGADDARTRALNVARCIERSWASSSAGARPMVVLGIVATSTTIKKDARAAYKKLAKVIHPDKCGWSPGSEEHSLCRVAFEHAKIAADVLSTEAGTELARAAHQAQSANSQMGAFCAAMSGKRHSFSGQQPSVNVFMSNAHSFSATKPSNASTAFSDMCRESMASKLATHGGRQTGYGTAYSFAGISKATPQRTGDVSSADSAATAKIATADTKFFAGLMKSTFSPPAADPTRRPPKQHKSQPTSEKTRPQRTRKSPSDSCQSTTRSGARAPPVKRSRRTTGVSSRRCNEKATSAQNTNSTNNPIIDAFCAKRPAASPT